MRRVFLLIALSVILPGALLAAPKDRDIASATGQPAGVSSAPVALSASGAGAGPAQATSATPSASSSASSVPVLRASKDPDPAPVTTRSQWRYEIDVRDGVFTVPAPTRFESARPVSSPRKYGRFAIEILVGDVLLDRIRFEIPMMPGEEPDPKNRAIDLEKKVRTRVRVDVPHNEKANRAVLVDRLTGRVQAVPWPPVDRLSSGPPLKRYYPWRAVGLSPPAPVP